MAAKKSEKHRETNGVIKPHSIEELEAALGRISRCIKQDEPSAAISEIKDWPTEDLVDLIVHLPLPQARTLLGWMPRKQAAEILANMHPANRATVVRSGTEDVQEMVEEMPAEEAMETRIALPKKTNRKVVREPNTPSVPTEYPPGSAGFVMQREVLALPESIRADEAIEAIRKASDRKRAVGTVFIINEQQCPIGVFRPRELLKTAPETVISDIMEKEFPTVPATTNASEVVRTVEGRDYMGIPVVDDLGRLAGQITPLIREQIIAESRRRGMLRMSSVSIKSSSTDGVVRIIKGRLPWLLAGLIGATVAAIVIGSFEEQLEAAAILAAFIPVVMSMAGNSGLQAAGVSVQALASGSVWPGDRMIYRLIRECCGALSNGAIAGTILALLVMLGSMIFDIERPLDLALSTSFSLMTVTTIAAIVGSSVPFALNRFGINPANATGVFITTSNDVLGVLVYFGMADLFYF
jgi:magnesium transporter